MSSPEAEDLSRDFTTILASHCRAYSRALEIEKLKAQLFHGPKGAGIHMTGVLLLIPIN